ncbi:MAG: AmmeMemoRadiSam system protein B [Planctomycetes bacterium]|nr:AmmeMemoRadiSam system protein B [Planctomycetota bacterium]
MAGQFYPAGADACREELERYLRAAVRANSAPARRGRISSANYIGGLVPHAGWRCSGAVAARVFAALSARCSPDVIVLFGGVHRYRGRPAVMFTSGQWETPLGPVEIDSVLCARLLESSPLIADEASAHEDEHSLEVQMPFLRHVFPDAKVVPIMVPIDKIGTEIGEAVGRAVSAYDKHALIVGTTDLTHYGPRYGFTPHGVGAEANAWAKDDNDRRFVDLLCSLKADELVPEASNRRNACNSGAAAATVAACVSMGATRGVLLEHTTSYEVLSAEVYGEQNDSVGYAGIVFEKGRVKSA